MQTSDSTSLRLKPDLGELSSLIATIETFAEEHGVGPADTLAFALAAEELFANTINHGKTATFAQFSLTLADSFLTAVYADDAPVFDPTEHAEPDTSLPAAERIIGGLGIHLIRRTMTVFRYARRDNRNEITFGRPLNYKPG
jgi:serine/threonine-protein kinase RsbW